MQRWWTIEIRGAWIETTAQLLKSTPGQWLEGIPNCSRQGTSRADLEAV
jgi:hypothetical protein